MCVCVCVCVRVHVYICACVHELRMQYLATTFTNVCYQIYLMMANNLADLDQGERLEYLNNAVRFIKQAIAKLDGNKPEDEVRTSVLLVGSGSIAFPGR